MILRKYYFFCFFFLTQLTSIRFFYNFAYTKHSPEFYFSLYLIISSITFVIFVNLKLFNLILKNTNLFWLILFLFTCYIFYKYPLSIGTERDDCYLIILNNLVNFKYPYSKTNLGDPCSTGLSAIIFYFPSYFYKNYFALTTTFYYLIFYFVLKKYFNEEVLRFILYIQILNLLFLEEAIGGSDFFLISISYLVGLLFLQDYFNTNSLHKLFFASIMLYFFYGSRSVFIFLVPLNFIFFYNSYKSLRVVKFFFFIFLISLITILFPIIIDFNNFHPFHLFLKGFNIIKSNLLILFSFLILIFIITAKLKKFIFDFFLYCKKYNIIINLLFLILPLSLVIIITFFNRLAMSQINLWEGLSYFILIYPSFVFIISYFCKNKNIFNYNIYN